MPELVPVEPPAPAFPFEAPGPIRRRPAAAPRQATPPPAPPVGPNEAVPAGADPPWRYVPGPEARAVMDRPLERGRHDFRLTTPAHHVVACGFGFPLPRGEEEPPRRAVPPRPPGGGGFYDAMRAAGRAQASTVPPRDWLGAAPAVEEDDRDDSRPNSVDSGYTEGMESDLPNSEASGAGRTPRAGSELQDRRGGGGRRRRRR